VPPATCQACKQLFAANEDNNEFADLLEREVPQCACEQFSVGQNSPGRVEDGERLQRLIVSPRDYDPDTKQILERPFYKLFGNGLSVCRAIATDADVERLAIEGLSHRSSDRHREVIAVCEVTAQEVRSMTDGAGSRIFCVYDQTVTPVDPHQPPVPTHAGIFQRLPQPGTADGKRIRKDYAGRLKERFVAGTLKLEDLRNGVFVLLNDRASQREFARP
jgi:hypothetical protein